MQYAAACRRRDLRLGAVLVTGFVFFAIALSLKISGFLRGPEFDVLPGVGLAVIAVAFAYVIATTRRFHRTHAPRCPSCDRSLPKLRPMLPILSLLREFDEDLDAPQQMREQLREVSVLHCSYCHVVMVGRAFAAMVVACLQLN